MSADETFTTQSCAHRDAQLDQLLRSEGPINLPHAYEVMDQFELTGLVVALPVNVYHLLGYWPQLANTRVDQPPTTFVLLSRDERQQPRLVTSRFIYYYTYVDGGYTRDLPIYLYQEAVDRGPDEQITATGDKANSRSSIEFPDQEMAPLSVVEERRRKALDTVAAARETRSHAGTALVQAMRDLGLDRGRIAFDHPLIHAVCENHDITAELVPGDNMLRWIRLVKSPVEIELMRRAAAANADALTAVGEQIRNGATHAELRNLFEVEAARRGNRAVFLNVDRVSSEISNDVIHDGQVFFLDGVSQFRHYHGDYARTVFVGEPLAPARKAAAAVEHAWQAIREQLRPGISYSNIVELGREAVKKGGFDFRIGFGPHSVGLMHTDEPGIDCGGFYGKLDLTLRENMILSVDCPIMNTGVGGSAHIEDLMLITADGAEPIHEIGDAVVTI